MNSPTPHPSYVVGNENCQSMFPPSTYLTWPHLDTFEMEADAELAPQAAVPQFFMPNPQNQVIQPNVPTQPSQTWQQTFSAQEISGLSYVAPQLDIQELDPIQFAPDNVPGSPQPPFDDWSPTSTIQGELPFEPPPWPSQSQVARPELPDTAALVADAQPKLYLCPPCKAAFSRRQERDRHVWTHLPHFLYCTIKGCPWRGNRPDNLKKHVLAKHAHIKFTLQPRRWQIYNPDLIVDLIVRDQLSVESAAEIALLFVGFRAHELKKVGIWKNGWGHKAKRV